MTTFLQKLNEQIHFTFSLISTPLYIHLNFAQFYLMLFVFLEPDEYLLCFYVNSISAVGVISGKPQKSCNCSPIIGL